MCIRVHSKGQFWQIVDGPSRLVLWKSEKKISFVPCAVICSFILNLRFLTVHVNVLEVSFPMQSEFPMVLGYREMSHQSAGS